MLLTIDVGNTNTLLGLYDGDTLRHHWRIKTDRDRMPDEYGMMVLSLFSHSGCDTTCVDGIVMASVVPPLTKIFSRMCERYFERLPLSVTSNTKTGIRIKIDNPHRLGADRIVDALAAHRLYGGPACVVDFGTATTFDVVSAEADYLGGIIVPGIGISADALFVRAAKLPRVELIAPRKVIGKNTVQAIQSGLVYGYTSLVEGMVRRIKAEVGQPMQVVATGGLARTFAEQTDAIDHINPWLTLEGLRMVWEMNR